MTVNLALRAATELGIVLAMAAWGFHAGSGPLARGLLVVAAPLLVFGFWGAVDFRWLGRAAEPVRHVQELALAAVAVLALAQAGAPALGWALALVSGVHHALVVVLGQRLLKA